MEKTLLSQRRCSFVKKHITSFFSKLLIFILLIGLSYVVLYPFLFKILPSFMSEADQSDSMVELLPTRFVLDNYRYVLENTDFKAGFFNTLLYSVLTAILTTASSAMVGYGLARFKSAFSSLLMVIVVLTMLVPIQTISLPLYSTFRYFDILGLIELISGNPLELTNTIWPTVILAGTCLGFRAGIFIILMRQYYIGIPNELIEAAYVDGSGVLRTFIKVIVPMAKTMMVVVFSLSFAWEWTDIFYSELLSGGTKLLSNVVMLLNSTSYNDANLYANIITANTAAILAIIPLLVFYLILQKRIIQGIESSGLVG